MGRGRELAYPLALASGDRVEAPGEQGFSTIAADFNDLLAPGAVKLAARIEQVNGRHHPLLEHPVATLRRAVRSHELEFHV